MAILEHTTEALRRAWVAFGAQRLSEAEFSCRLALGANKKNFEALHLMGLIEFQRGRLDSAQSFIRSALKIRPDAVHALCNLGLVLQNQGRHEEALINIDKCLRIDPDNLIALNNRGHILWRLKRPQEALADLDRALLLKHDYSDALCNRGNVFTDLEQFENALSDFEWALKLNPRDAIALNNRANILWALDRREEALQVYDAAFAIEPKDLSILKDRGSALLYSDREEDALACFDSALQIKPDDVYFIYKRGTALAKLNRFEEALACFDQSLELEASNVDALNGRGNALSALSRAAEAIVSYDRALQIDPETPEAHWNRSLTLLRMGDFEQGWKEYEWRWKTSNFTSKPRNFEQPLWLGEQSISQKTILLHAEQGFGDTIQFARYVPLVSALGAKVVVEVQPPLKNIFSGIEGASLVISSGEQLPSFDVHCPMLSLPLAFKTRIATIPNNVPYLRADLGTTTTFATLGEKKERPLVGVAWAGRPTYGGDKTRSIGLVRLAPVLSVPGFQFVGIQKDLREGDREILSTYENLTWLGDKLTDFADTAALMAQLDLIISSDTSVVHLAGALGKPVWILLEHTPDWRWLLDRADCPWYPSARLFRQAKAGDWDSVILEVIDAMQLFKN